MAFFTGLSLKRKEGLSVEILVMHRTGQPALFGVKVNKKGTVMGGSDGRLEPKWSGPQIFGLCGVHHSNKLYLVPCQASVQKGYILDFQTRNLNHFKPCELYEESRTVIYAYEKIYFLLDPFWPVVSSLPESDVSSSELGEAEVPCEVESYQQYDLSTSTLVLPESDVSSTELGEAEVPCKVESFQRYDISSNTLANLKPFPYSRCSNLNSFFTGYLSWCKSIILSMECDNKLKVMAYDTQTDSWVEVDHCAKLRCWTKKAFTIHDSNIVLAVSVRGKLMVFRVDSEGDKFSLNMLLEHEMGTPVLYGSHESQCLAHLGDLKFCLVRSNCDERNWRQPFSVTTFEFVEGTCPSIQVLDSRKFEVDVLESDLFYIDACFMLGREDDDKPEFDSYPTILEGRTERRYMTEEGITNNFVWKNLEGNGWSSCAMKMAKVVVHYGYVPWSSGGLTQLQHYLINIQWLGGRARVSGYEQDRGPRGYEKE